MKKTRILLADDHTLVRAGIRALLEKQDDMEIVGEAADGQEALQKVAELRPDVIIMDIAMPGMGGMEATKRIKSQYPHVQVLALTMLEDDRYFFEIIQAGASGFIIKGDCRTNCCWPCGRSPPETFISTLPWPDAWSVSISARPAAMAPRSPPMS